MGGVRESYGKSKKSILIVGLFPDANSSVLQKVLMQAEGNVPLVNGTGEFYFWHLFNNKQIRVEIDILVFSKS